MSTKTAVFFMCLAFAVLRQAYCLKSLCLDDTTMKPVPVKLADFNGTWYSGGYTYPIPILIQCLKYVVKTDEKNDTKGVLQVTGDIFGVKMAFPGPFDATEVPGIFKYVFQLDIFGIPLSSYTYMTILDHDTDHAAAAMCGPYGITRGEGSFEHLTTFLIILTRKKGESVENIKRWKEQAEAKNPNMKLDYEFRYQNYDNCKDD